MNATLCLALLALAPQDLPRPAADTQQEVPILADIPLLSEVFANQDRVVPDPELRWNGQTEDVYRRALHQMNVRGNYAEAVRLLLSIADSDPVIQVPGQASWVLGQAALALCMDGRTDEAAKMLPGIRNGAAGTELESQVGVLLGRIDAYRGASQQLDETFRIFLWERLKEYPRDEKDRGSDIREYGRLTLPYLEQIVGGQLRMGASGFGQGDITQAQKAMAFALRVADDGFVDRMLALFREFPPLTTRVVLQDSPPPGMDAQAESAQARLYVALAKEADAARREIGMEGVLRIAQRAGAPEAMAFLEGVLAQPGDVRRAALLEDFREGTIYRHEAWTAFVAEAARSADAEAREAARWGMVGEEHRQEELRAFALAPGKTRVDKLRFLMQFCSPHREASGRRSPLEKLAGEALEGSQAYAERPYNWRTTREWTDADKELLLSMAGGADAGVAAMAAYAAQSASDDGLVDAVFPLVPEPVRTALLASAGSWRFSRDTALALLDLAAAGSEEARTALARGGFAHLRVAEVQATGVDWTDKDWERYAQARGRMATEDRRDLVDLLGAPGGFPVARTYAVFEQVPRAAILRGIQGVENWSLGASDVQSWRDFLGQLGQRIRNSGPGVRTDEPLGPLGDRLVRHLWSACREQDWRTASLVDQFIYYQWLTEPERALPLAMELVTDAETLHLYREGWSPNNLETGGFRQQFLLHCLEQGWWPSEGSGDRVDAWLEPEYPEFVEVMRVLLRPDRDPAQALRHLEHYPEGRRKLASELERNWQDPELVVHLIDIYDDTAEIKEKVPQMLAAWELKDLDKRANVLGAMASTLDERVVPVLLEALGDPDQNVAKTARAGLERLREVREQREYWEAWEATGSTLSPVVALLQKLKSDKREVRIAAIRSLGTMKAPEALPFLVDLLEDADAQVREAAAAALEKING